MNKLLNFISVLLLLSILFTACKNGDDPVENTGPHREDYDNGYYIGEFNDKGERHGQGTYFWNTGDKYEGQWVNGKRHGQGTMTYANGDIYIGNWENSLRNGQGTLTYESGAKYVGNWKEGYASGQGEMTYANGNIYIGDWENNLRNGQGALTYKSGAKYVGNWKEDYASGQGEMTYENGNIYTGNWEKSIRNGQGTYTFKDGTIFTCEWKDDNPTDEKCFLLAKMKYWYFWNKELGVVDVSKYASAEEMLNSLKNQLDLSSSITNTDEPSATSNLFFEGKDIGYGFGVRWDVYGDLRVAWVHEDSPANLYGIKRGWKILKINGTNVYSLGSIVVSTDKENQSMILDMKDENGVDKTITLVSKTFKIQSVLYSNTYQVSAKKVGYIVLKSFVQPNTDEVKQKISSLANSNIQELIIDLRYCSGGNYATLNEFANAVFPSSSNGKAFMTRKYNQDAAANDTTYLIQKSGSLNLDRVFVLTSSSTTNLGEYLLMCLKPYTKVIQIGLKTHGTDGYGTSIWTFNEKKSHTLITAIFQNANKENCLGGFTPDCTTFDGVEKNWGDENEELLNNALYFIANGYFPAPNVSSGVLQQNENRKIQEKVMPAERIEIKESQFKME